MNKAEEATMKFVIKMEVKERHKWLNGQRSTYWMWNSFREELQRFYEKSGRV